MGRLTSHCVGNKANSQNQNKKGNRINARRLSILASASAVSFLTLKGHAQTTNLTWDPAQNVNNSLPASGGGGTWNTSLANWSNGTADVVWADTSGTLDNAVFGGTAGTVTLNTNLGTSDLIFQTSGYTISGTGILEMSNPSAVDLDTTALASTGTETLSAIDLHTSTMTFSLGAASVNFAGAVRDNGQSHLTLTVNGTGSALFSGGVTFSQSSSAHTILLAGSENINISGLIQDGNAGANFLTYDGAATLSLSGTSNTFGTTTSASTVTVESGVLAIAAAGSLGSPSNPLILGNNTATATFQGIGSSSISIANPVTLGGGGTGTSVIGGSTPLNFTGVVTGSGSSDDLNINNTAATTFSGTMYLSGNTSARTLNIGGTGGLTISAPIGNSAAAGAANSSLNYVGTGTLSLTNAANTFSGNLAVVNGTLVIPSNGAIGTSNTLALGPASGTPTGTPTLESTGSSVVTIAHPFTIDSASTSFATFGGTTPLDFTNTVVINGASTTSETINANDTGGVTFASNVYLASAGTFRTDTFAGTANLNIMGVVADDPTGPTQTSLTYSGTGTLTLGNANTYTGNTTLGSGVLDVTNTSGSATSTGNVTLNGGVLASGSVGSVGGNVLAGSGAHTIAPGGIGSIGTLTVNGLTTSTLTTLAFDLGTGSGLVTNGDNLILGSGTVSIANGTLLTFGGDAPVAGNDYQLIGDTSGSGAVVSQIQLANFTLPSAPAGLAYSLAESANFIDLDVTSTGPVSLFWDNAGGSGNGTNWDTSNQNWNNGSAATTYADGEAVTFNDTNAGHYFVTLSTTVSPASVTVNSSGNYSITGGGLIVATGGFTKTGTSTLTLGVGLTASSFAINGGNVVLASNTTASSGWTSTNPVSNINVSSLTIAANSVLDISNNHIIIDYGATDPMSTILGYLKSGFNNGTWTGTSGIISSTAQTKTNGLTYSVGWADGADKTGAVKNLTSGEIELKYTLVGDANLDGTVNGSDFSILAANFGLGVTNWDQGNFLYTSSVNGSDFSALAANFGQGDSGAAVTPADIAALDSFAAANGLPAPTIAAVPEPATLGLLAIGSLGLMSRRRKRETSN